MVVAEGNPHQDVAGAPVLQDTMHIFHQLRPLQEVVWHKLKGVIINIRPIIEMVAAQDRNPVIKKIYIDNGVSYFSSNIAIRVTFKEEDS